MCLSKKKLCDGQKMTLDHTKYALEQQVNTAKPHRARAVGISTAAEIGYWSCQCHRSACVPEAPPHAVLTGRPPDTCRANHTVRWRRVLSRIVHGSAQIRTLEGEGGWFSQSGLTPGDPQGLGSPEDLPDGRAWAAAVRVEGRAAQLWLLGGTKGEHLANFYANADGVDAAALSTELLLGPFDTRSLQLESMGVDRARCAAVGFRGGVALTDWPTAEDKGWSRPPVDMTPAGQRRAALAAARVHLIRDVGGEHVPGCTYTRRLLREPLPPLPGLGFRGAPVVQLTSMLLG